MRFEPVMAAVGGLSIFGMGADVTNADYYSIDCSQRRCIGCAPRNLYQFLRSRMHAEPRQRLPRCRHGSFGMHVDVPELVLREALEAGGRLD